jgi:predicted  nucleic acid-binding Zn-ribbon protein
MTEQRRTALKRLQKLDLQIQEARQRIHDFDPRFEEVEEPALVLESELTASRTRLKEMTLEERRLELGVEEKRERQRRLEERLTSVRNLREEAAVSAELEMIRRALQQDEQEALTLMDQMRKVEERLAELEVTFAEATELVEPKKQDLLAERAEARRHLESLEVERDGFASGMSAEELRIYEAIRAGGRRIAVAELTADGACGNCFGIVPLQVQNEILHGDALLRCEGCGVILAAAEPEPEVVEEPAPEPAGDASDVEAADGEGAAEATSAALVDDSDEEPDRE